MMLSLVGRHETLKRCDDSRPRVLVPDNLVAMS
jgi:hypothetical protein